MDIERFKERLRRCRGQITAVIACRTDPGTIFVLKGSLHIQNIYEEGELDPEATVKKYLTVRPEGSRTVKRPLDYYNLDMIIAVG